MINTSNRSDCFERSNTGRLATYCTLTLGACALGTVDGRAQIVNIDIAHLGGAPGQSFSGACAGLALGYQNTASDWLGSNTGGFSAVRNGFYGFYGFSGLELANGGALASPHNFGASSVIDGSSNFTGNPSYHVFAAPGYAASPDFGPGSYMGFRFEATPGNYKYGWLQVQWNQSTSYFEVFSGAYEATPNVGILAGAVAVPEPRSAVALGVLALGGAAVRRYRKARRERATSESEALAGVHS